MFYWRSCHHIENGSMIVVYAIDSIKAKYSVKVILNSVTHMFQQSFSSVYES